MPNKDGTWPNGQGSRTWRWMGPCKQVLANNPNTNIEEDSSIQGFGFWQWRWVRCCERWLGKWLWRKKDGTWPNGQGPKTWKWMGNC